MGCPPHLSGGAGRGQGECTVQTRKPVGTARAVLMKRTPGLLPVSLRLGSGGAHFPVVPEVLLKQQPRTTGEPPVPAAHPATPCPLAGHHQRRPHCPVRALLGAGHPRTRCPQRLCLPLGSRHELTKPRVRSGAPSADDPQSFPHGSQSRSRPTSWPCPHSVLMVATSPVAVMRCFWKALPS